MSEEPPVVLDEVPAIIPRPQKMRLSACAAFDPRRVRMDLPSAPPVQSWAKTFQEKCARLSDGQAIAGGAPPLAVRASVEQRLIRLDDRACRPQGYTIDVREADARLLCTIRGFDQAGIAYALITLSALLKSSEQGVSLPVGFIADSPDLTERGLFLGIESMGETSREQCASLRELAALKINAADFGLPSRPLPFKSGVCPDASGNPKAFQTILDAARSLGMRANVYIPHLEQFKMVVDAHPEIRSKTPGGTGGGICMTSPATLEVMAALANEIVSNLDFDELSIWSSEGYINECQCERCREVGTFLAEVELIRNVFDEVRREFPDKPLRYLTSARTYQCESVLAHTMGMDKVMEYFGGDVAISTYRVVKSDFIPPQIRKLAAEGFKVSVVPAFGWGAGYGVPLMFCEHIRWKMNEIFNAGLYGTMGWTGRRARMCDLTIAAGAEFGWNCRARETVEFLEEYARLHDYPEPRTVAEIFRDLEPAHVLMLDHNLRYGFGGHSRIRSGLERMLADEPVDGLDRQHALILGQQILEPCRQALRKSRAALKRAAQIDHEWFRTQVSVVHNLSELMFNLAWIHYVWVREKDPDVYKGPWDDPKEEYARCISEAKEALNEVKKHWPVLVERNSAPEGVPLTEAEELCEQIARKYLG